MWVTVMIGLVLAGIPGLQDDQVIDIQAQKKILQRGTIEAKHEALQRIAAAALAESPPSKALAKLLAFGLEDDSFDVRSDAATRLARGQHPDVSIPAMTHSLEELRKELARMARPRGRDAEDRRHLRDLRNWTKTLSEALGSLSDDRSVQALIDFGRRTAGSRDQQIGLIVARALVKLGARPGIAEVIKRLSSIEANDNRREGRMGAKPGRIGPQLHDLLTEAGRSRGLKGMPVVWTKGTDAEWRAWFQHNQKSFPARLGRLEVK